MPGGANFHPYPVPLGGRASAFAVVRYDRDAGTKTLLPNVLPLEIHRVEGPVPPSARFAYVFDDSMPGLGLPTAIEEVWPLAAQGGYIVRDDDELLVYEYRESGQRVLLFDGFAQVPQANLAPDGQSATFAAVGVAIRLWDTPIAGCTMRQSDDIDAGDVLATGLPTWFNPDGQPNRTPDGKDVNGGARDGYPVFLDVNLPDDQLKLWTLADFVKYVLWVYNPDEEYVKNPSSLNLTSYLQAVTPRDGSSYYDLKDPNTYDATDIVINSFNATNLPPVEALARQLHYYGFEVFFDLVEDSKGRPENRLVLYRKDGRDGNAPKRLYSPDAGSSLADGLPDVDVIALARDEHRVANAFAIETAPVQYEASFILAPDFAIDQADASDVSKFDKAKLATADDAIRKAYRRFVVDEAGTGHWDHLSSAYVTKQPTKLDAILGAPTTDRSDPKYVTRPRPGKGTLVSRDDADRPRKATLALSRDYAGESPAVWDPADTATWRELGTGGWKLLTDALGIEITAENPETWTIPRDKDDTSAAKGDKVRVVSSLADPSASGDKDSARFFLRLTCVIEDDSGIDATADRRDAAPGKFTVLQRIDSRDHFRKQVVCASSIHNDSGKTPPEDVTKRDDTDAAKAKADALRAAHEMPMVAGEIRIPGIAHAVGVGDFLGGFTGRGIDLASNAGGPLGESPHYPVVVGVSYTLQDPQTTVLRLSDRRAEPERYFRNDGS